MAGSGLHQQCYKPKPSFLRASAPVQILLSALDLHAQVCIWPWSWMGDALTQHWAQHVGGTTKLSLAPGDLSIHPGVSSQQAWAWSPFHSPLPQNCSRHACRSCHAPGFLGNYEMRFSQDSALGSGAGGLGGSEAGKNLR